MKWLTVMLALVPTLGHADEVWRWTNANGTLCYSNRAAVTPPDATAVRTRLGPIPDREPDLMMDRGMVIDAGEARPPTRESVRRPHRIYSERRRLFGCYASSVLYSGGWAHPDDITVIGNCLPYLLGPEAWLNAARAELALREHGIDWRELVSMYVAQGEAGSTARARPRRTAVSVPAATRPRSGRAGHARWVKRGRGPRPSIPLEASGGRFSLALR
jgi:uncharacterized protein DUF4124